MVRRSLLLASVLALFALEAKAADDDLFTLDKRLTVYRLFAGPDGRSHVDTVTLENVVPTRYGGKRLLEATAHRVKMGLSSDGGMMDYHVADHRTLLVPLQGTLVIDVGDGKTYRLHPGNVALAEDRTGRGHRSGCEALAGARQCLTLQIDLDDRESGLQVPGG